MRCSVALWGSTSTLMRYVSLVALQLAAMTAAWSPSGLAYHVSDARPPASSSPPHATTDVASRASPVPVRSA
jgi:hypothetical protein